MNKTLWKLAAAVALFAGALGAQNTDYVAKNAWVRAVPPVKTETAMYVVLENHTAQKREIVGGSTDAADKLELHEMKMNRAVMTMTPIARVTLPAKGKAEFSPNSFHIMLFGLKNKLTVGDTVTATLKLDDGTLVPVAAKVKKE